MSMSALITPALLLAAYGTAFFFHGAHDITYAPAIFLVLAASLTCVLPSMRREISFPRGTCVLLTLAFWCYLSISLLWTNVPFTSLVTWLNLSVLPLILMGLLCARDRLPVIRYSALTLAGGTFIVALYTLWQFFDEGMPRAPGLLLNPNNMAAIFNLSLLPVLAYGIAGEQRHRMIAGGVAMILFAALLATGSRAGLICFVLGLVVILFALRKTITSGWKPAGAFIAVLIVVFAGFYFLSGTALPLSLAVFGDPTADYSSFERLAIWKGALLMLRDHWAGGTGLGTFYLYYPAYRLDGDLWSIGNWAHIDALQFGVETGILGTVLFYAAAVAWAFRGMGALSQMPADDARRPLVAGCLAALLALTAHAHIEFQFYVLATLIVAAVLMAALYALTTDREEQSCVILSPAKRERAIWSGALLLTTGLISLMLLSAAAGTHFLNRANAALNKGNLDGFVSNITLSRQYAPRSFADASVQLAAFYVDLLAQRSGMMTEDDRRTAYQDALQLLAEAQAVNPALADIDHKRAKLYARIDDALQPDRINLAMASWREALRKNPMHFHAREEFARFLLKQGRVDEAYAILQDGLHRARTREAEAIFTRLSAQIAPLMAAKQQFRQQTPAQ